MSENKLCPHCGGKMFMATITRACLVEVSTDKENPYKIMKEGKDKFDIAILKCARCREDITEEQLVSAVACKECGRLVTPADVDENGVCDVCNAMKQRTELANASKEDLVKMLLEAEKRSNPVAAKMAEKQNVATDNTTGGGFTLTPVEDETPAEEDVVPVEEAPAQPKKRARRKKTDNAVTEATEDTVAETEEAATEEEAPAVETEVPVEEAVADLANQQEAPFPDMNLPEEMVATPEPQPVQEEQAVGAVFPMFDEDGGSF